MLVTIYIETTIRGPARRNGTGMWLVEYIKQDGTPVTRPDEDHQEDSIKYMEGTTENALTLELLIDAFSILTKSCSVRVNTQCEHVLNATQNYWLEQWAKNDWHKTNGKPVANADLWQQVYEYMQIHDVIFENEENNYRNVMQLEILKEEKKHV